MKKNGRKVLAALLVTFLLMQLYQPARNKNEMVSTAHIASMFEIPDSVNKILANSCYDCHSNHTNYPWYSYIQPVRFIMDRHIRRGKKELNFSEFGNYSKRRQESKLESIGKQVKSGDMPLPSYTLLHKDAKLNPGQKQTVLNWVDSVSKKYE